MLISHSRHTEQQGFTILELMVASAIFTVVLIIVAVGVVGFTNSYYKGITSSKTQAATRAIMNAVAQSLQFGRSYATLSSGGVQGICIDNTLYSYKIGQEVVDTNPQGSLHQDYHGLVVSNPNNCAGATPSLPSQPNNITGRELLGDHMRLSIFSVVQSGNLFTIRVRVIYGDDDLLTNVPTWSSSFCQGGISGTQFCAVSDLQTTVERRLL